jgi:hypothetical protein
MPEVVLVANVIKIVPFVCYRDMNMRHDRLAVGLDQMKVNECNNRKATALTSREGTRATGPKKND